MVLPALRRRYSPFQAQMCCGTRDRRTDHRNVVWAVWRRWRLHNCPCSGSHHWNGNSQSHRHIALYHSVREYVWGVLQLRGWSYPLGGCNRIVYSRRNSWPDFGHSSRVKTASNRTTKSFRNQHRPGGHVRCQQDALAMIRQTVNSVNIALNDLAPVPRIAASLGSSVYESTRP